MEWFSEHTGPYRAITGNRIRRFDAAVQLEYSLALFRTVGPRSITTTTFWWWCDASWQRIFVLIT